MSIRGIIAALFVAAVAALCIRLGFWQLDRLEQRKMNNAAAAAAFELPPLELDSAGLARISADPEAFVGRRARAVGSYLPGDLVLRGRSHAGQPGVHLVTPLQPMHSRELILINRGWVPSPDGATSDPRDYPMAGTQEVVGILQRVPDVPSEAAPLLIALPDTGITTLRRLDRTTLATKFEPPLSPLYLQQSDPGDNVPPIAVPPPELDEGPHLGYAMQWFSFAAIAVIGFLLLVARRRQEGASPPPLASARPG